MSEPPMPSIHGILSSMGPGKSLREPIRFGIDDEIDIALGVAGDVVLAMPRHHRKSQALEQRPQGIRIRRGIFHELEAVSPHWVLKKLCHGRSPRRAISYNCNYYTPVVPRTKGIHAKTGCLAA